MTRKQELEGQPVDPAKGTREPAGVSPAAASVVESRPASIRPPAPASMRPPPPAPASMRPPPPLPSLAQRLPPPPPPPMPELRRPIVPRAEAEPLSQRERTAQIGGPGFLPGTVVAGKFTLQRPIASGGMGTVFEAWDTFVERKVALKLMHPHLNADAGMVARFRREAQAAARIQHPNVVTVFEVGMRRDGAFYIVQELLSGRTLRHHLEQRRRLDPEEALSIVVPIMGGLAAAHASGIIHRDIKPENIVLSRSPSGEIVPKIIDFGLAKLSQDPSKQGLTQFGMIVGTPHYMAPEQAEAGTIDARTDIWAMGVVLFEMLAGVRPYDGETIEAVLIKILTRPPLWLEAVAPEAASPIAPVVHRALARDPAARFQSMQAFRDELLAAHGSQQRAFFHISTAALSTTQDPAAVPTPAEAAPIFDEIALDDLVLDLHPPEADEGELPVAARVEPEEPPLSEMEPASVRALELRTSRMLAPMPASEAEWRGPRVSPSRPRTTPVEKAELALDHNALEEAIRWVEIGLREADGDEDIRGRLWLAAAIAHRWLGNYGECVRAAQEALARMPRGSNGWHAAFGHLVIAYGHLGRKDRLLARVDELRALEEEDGISTEAHLVSACRLSVYVVRAGVPQLGQRLLRAAQGISARQGNVGPFLRAWLDAGRAELALLEGDLTTHLRRLEASSDHFTSARDVRNACLQRAGVGRAYASLGAHDRAILVLRESLSLGAPMQLDFVAFTRACLGFALAHVGKIDEGIEAATEALGQAKKHGDRQLEAMTLTYLSRMRAMQRRLDDAFQLAMSATEVADVSPGARAHALAAVAATLLVEGQPAAALGPSIEAVQILEGLAGVEEGDSLIRLVHARALHETGQVAEARRRLLEARSRLQAKAERIGDARFRQGFLTKVPDNVELLQTASAWGLG